jgi:hypothetical protein
MHDGAALSWFEIVEHHHACLIDELTNRLDSDLRDAVAKAVAEERTSADGRLTLARYEAQTSQAELLNQALRRLRQANGEEHILQALSESCAPYAQHAVVLVFENNQARCIASHDTEPGPVAFDIAFDIAAAPAVVTAIETRDPVIAMMTEAELSTTLMQKIGLMRDGKSDQNAYLFPLSARHSVVAMLIAWGDTPVVSSTISTIELLCEAAGMRLETLVPDPQFKNVPSAAETVPASAAADRLSWDTLSPEDQRLHLQAQRTARVRVAEMRLYNEQELRAGSDSGDIYGAMQTVIDPARQQFLQTYLAKSPTMVDYLHLEILHTLAHDDDRLLGNNYPGPMV